MPTPTELRAVDPIEGDGSTIANNDDGSNTVSWPNGMTRVNEPDGSAIITFADFSVLNLFADGTRTLNDASGNALDPNTGESASGGEGALPKPPATTVDELSELVEGLSSIADLGQASGILRALGVAAVVDKQYGALSELAIAFSEALKGEVSPVSWFKSAFKMILAVVKALETEERGVSMRAWCYTTVYDAMGMGAPAAQVFNGSLRGPEQDAVNQQAWDDSVAQCKEQLADGAKGVALRNRVLLLIAKCSANPGQAVTELWANACEASEDRQLLAAFPVLDWPEPTR